jgi:hypothetical protein
MPGPADRPSAFKEENVSHSLCLLAAALLAGQTPAGQPPAMPADGASAGVVTGSPASPRWQSGPVYESPENNRGGLLSRIAGRIRGLFRSEEPAPPWHVETMPAPAARPAGAPAAGAVEESDGPPTMNEPPLASPSAGPAAPGPLPAITQPAPKLTAPGHDEQYHNIAGRLAYLPSGGGTWLLHYGDNGADRVGGLVILSPVARMDGLRNGDLVSVQGELLNERPEAGFGAPVYRAYEVTFIQHAD